MKTLNIQNKERTQKAKKRKQNSTHKRKLVKITISQWNLLTSGRAHSKAPQVGKARDSNLDCLTQPNMKDTQKLFMI